MAIDPLTAALDLGTSIINKIWPDPAQQADALLKLKELEQKGDLAEMQAYTSLLVGQLEINKEEAKHPSIFVAGARPFIMWVGGFSLGYAGVIEPLMRFVANICGYVGEFPVINTDMTIQILLGTLGLGAMRSFDKTKGTCTARVSK